MADRLDRQHPGRDSGRGTGPEPGRLVAGAAAAADSRKRRPHRPAPQHLEGRAPANVRGRCSHAGPPPSARAESERPAAHYAPSTSTAAAATTVMGSRGPLASPQTVDEVDEEARPHASTHEGLIEGPSLPTHYGGSVAPLVRLLQLSR